MAVIGLQLRKADEKVILGRDMMGTGTPIGDTAANGINNISLFPVGTQYLDLATGNVYYKTAYAADTATTTWKYNAGL